MPIVRPLLAKVNYQAHLDACWKLHLEPRQADAPTVISTFAGCGGSSLGYSMAGFKELLAVEWDAHAVATFKANFTGVPVYHGDICKLTVEECLSLAGIEPGELDVLDGSPPCQGFSTAGKRQMADSRNQLFREYVRLLQGLRPKVFVMENVSGMVKGKMKLIFAEIMRELKASDYNVSARLLNAKYFGVPQSRQRMIFIGVRSDLGIRPGHPKAKYAEIRAGEVLPGCSATGSQSINPWMYDSSCATIPKTNAGYSAKFKIELDEAAIKETWQMYRVLTGQERHKHFSLVKVQPDKVAGTISKDAGNTSTGLVHPFEIRKLTISEAKALQSFHANFAIDGSYHQKWAVIGNSVPPLFMYEIARHIRENILSQATPTGTLQIQGEP